MSRACPAGSTSRGGTSSDALTDRYAGKILHVDHGHCLSLQYHERKDESNYLLRGRLRLTRGTSVDDLSEVELGPGDVWRNTPGLIHSIEALEDTDVLEVSTPDLYDLVRLQDDYGRCGQPRTTVPSRARRRAL